MRYILFGRIPVSVVDAINLQFCAGKGITQPSGEPAFFFLEKYFPGIVDYAFTAHTEDELDSIASGKQVWNKMVGSFYKSFHPSVREASEASRKEVSQARLVGQDPKTKQPIYARFGKYGPVLQRGETESEEKPTFAPLPANTKIETVTLEQAKSNMSV